MNEVVELMRQLALAHEEISRLRNIAHNACDWLEANTDRSARRFHAANFRRAIDGGSREPGDGYCVCGERLDKEHTHGV